MSCVETFQLHKPDESIVEDAEISINPANFTRRFSRVKQALPTSEYKLDENFLEFPRPSRCSKKYIENTEPPFVCTAQLDTEPVPSSSESTPKEQLMALNSGGIVYTLRVIREPIVDYQDTRGVPRTEQITFVNLITSLCTQAYTAAITIFVMLWNLIPLLEGILIFVRFVLDKLIDILETRDPKDKALKSAVFFGELIVVLVILFLIIGLIFVPVYVLTSKLFGKVLGMIW